MNWPGRLVILKLKATFFFIILFKYKYLYCSSIFSWEHFPVTKILDIPYHQEELLDKSLYRFWVVIFFFQLWIYNNSHFWNFLIIKYTIEVYIFEAYILYGDSYFIYDLSFQYHTIHLNLLRSVSVIVISEILRFYFEW